MVTNSTVAHNFANGINQHQEAGHLFWVYETSWNQDTKTMEQTGKRTIYSYGRHFAIATIDEPNKVCLFTTRGYSNTTAKHINYVAGAIDEYKYHVIYCFDPEGSKRDNLKHYIQTIANLSKKAIAARTRKAQYLREIQTEYNRALQYAHYMNLAATVDANLLNELDAAYNQTQTAEGLQALNNTIQKEREAEKQLKKEQERARAERVAEWEQGKRDYLSFSDVEKNVPLRIETRKGYEIIKTGKGVDVPMNEAKRVAALLLSNDLDGLTVNGYYRIREANAKIIRIGCHTFNRAYLENWAHKIMN